MAVTRRSLFGGFAALAASPFVAKAVAALPAPVRLKATGYAKINIAHVQNGEIVAVNVTNGGSGYTMPAITFTDT